MGEGLFCDRNELGRPMVAPTSEMDVVVFGYRPNKDLELTLHNPNKKETRGGLSVRVFLHRIVFNLKTVMLLPFQAAQAFVGNVGSSPIKKLDQPHRKFFWFFSFKKRTRNPYSNLTITLLPRPR